MLISDLSKMEEIVASHPELSWDGWNVVRHKKNSNAQFDIDGIYKNGAWYKQYVFPITEHGWSIPERIAR